MLNPSITTFLSNRDATLNTNRPRAWLNIVVLDEQLKPVITSDGKNSYFQQVGATNQSTVQYDMTVSQREITKSGYVYVYVSNESTDVNVYFDNLQVSHIKSPLLQEEGYYPFGLEMKAISSQAALKIQTNYKFNAGTALEDNFNVDYYETYFRNYDAQIGRFTGIDALAESYAGFTPYNFGINNPVSVNDPTGAYAYDNESMQRDGFDSRGGLIFDNSLDGFNGNSSLGSAIGYRGGGGGGNQKNYTKEEIAKFWSNIAAFASGDEDAAGYIVNKDGKVISKGTNNNISVWLKDIIKDQQNMNQVSYEYLGTLGTIIRSDKIIFNLLHGDIIDAKHMSGLDFRNAVEDKGIWDFKRNLDYIYGIAAQFDRNNSKYGFSTKFIFNGYSMTSEDIGNFHYGVVGLANGRFSETMLFQAAGYVQIRDGRSRSEWQNTIYWGDDPKDHYWIQQGFNYYYFH